MKNIIILMFVLVVAASGCETMGEKTKKGAAIGAITGAAIGGIVGYQDGHAWEGALIGGAAGGVGGGLIGNQMEKNQMATNTDYLSTVQISQMAQDNVPDGVIISEIDRTKSKYELTSEVIDYLEENGVSDKVIDHMLATVR